ncbi:hypothetical protein [Enterobacter hormaechei]|uniref:hypothetical protein n=1 Tax=Enterobacter hormaechei TaxID=158836 RepID=UPI001BE06F7B|nr:hypothetical protein [Enterobacter hormaechei subsp. xiangfangensis]HAV1851648.1 hypothetical protein [Enterobacter hormaechei subsp. xiangfangensis]
MGWSSLVRITIGTFLLAGLSFSADAKNCKKGIPCGNSCIAAWKTCGGSSRSTSINRHLYSYPSSPLRSTIPKSTVPSPSENFEDRTSAATTKTYLCQYAIASVQNGKIGSLSVLGNAKVNLYTDSFKAFRMNGTYLISPKLNTNGKLMMADDKSKVYAYDPRLLNFAISDRIARSTEQWDRCKLVHNN